MLITENDTRSQLIELVKIWEIRPTFCGWILHFPTKYIIKLPEDLKEHYRESVLSAMKDKEKHLM